MTKTTANTSSRRRGTAYLFAVGLSLLVGVAAMGALLVSRAFFDRSHDILLVARADAAAESGFHWAFRILNSNALYSGGVAAGTMNYKAGVGPDSVSVDIGPFAGAVAVNHPIPVDVRSTSDAGIAGRILQARALPVPRAYPAFEYAMSVGGTLALTANGDLRMTAADSVASAIILDAAANVNGKLSKKTGATDIVEAIEATTLVVSFPPASAMDTLIARATPIVVAGPTVAISNVLVSPLSNPFGLVLNTEGIYLLDCGGRRARIGDLRIVGTLIVINPGANSELYNDVYLEPAVRGYPCLIVRGDFALSLTNGRVRETTVNFNPQGTPAPYVGGVFDSATDDNWTVKIGGSIWITGDCSMSGRLDDMANLVVNGSVHMNGRFQMACDPWAVWSPAPGLAVTRWQVEAGSWTQPLK